MPGVSEQAQPESGARPHAEAVGAPPRRLLAATRYRDPGDVIRLIAAAGLLIGTLVVLKLGSGWFWGPDALSVTILGSAAIRQVVTGVLQVALLGAAVLALAACLRGTRWRLLASLVVAAGLAAAATVLLLRLVSGSPPADLTAELAQDAWLGPASWPSPPLLAGAVAVAMVSAPWLTRAWRRAVWLALVLVLAARMLTGAVLPAELALAVAVGLTAGAAVRVVLGVPDRRIGPDQIADALGRSGLAVDSVSAALVQSKGSRPFVVRTADGRQLFVKALGPEQHEADVLYRAYRAVRLRDVGDTRPAPSSFQAVEHQALVGVMAQRSGVDVPTVDRLVRADEGNGLLVMEWIDGTSLADVTPERISDELLQRLWTEVGLLHGARIAHRSLRSGNVMVTPAGVPRVVDFSFSELDATPRQVDLDIAELLASLSGLVGEQRAVATAVQVLGPTHVAGAVPLLQPLALSAATRRAVRGHEGLLGRIRSEAAKASGVAAEELARLQRVRLRTLLSIVAASAAFYVLLPQLAQVESSWRAILAAQWVWFPVVVAFSVLTYVASAVSLLGSVSTNPPFWPTTLAQGASSFVNRVSPSNVGGMALNVRYLQKTGLPATAGVSAVGLNSLVGAIVHAVLLLTFLLWAGRGVSNAFKLPSSSTLLVVLAVAAAIIGIVLATRPGRRFAVTKVLPGLRSSWSNLRQVARSPMKLAMLFGGSALVTLAYVGALAASVQAFDVQVGIGEIGAIYLVASLIAAASPTPGGLGAIEAALVAGLTGVGVSSGVAVSAVLTYRLATYWVPVLPGWYCFRALQRWDYL